MFCEICAPKDLEMNCPEEYEEFTKNPRGKNDVHKIQKGGNPRVKLLK